MGIKFTDYNLMDFSLCKQVAGGRYNMLYGRDEQALPALLLGAEAAVSSTIGYSPTLRKAYALWTAGDREAGLIQQARNAKLCSMLGPYEKQGYNIQKAAMAMVGMAVGPSRLPKLDPPSEGADQFEADARALNLLDPK